jgi:arylsulfatase A-like enzyme
MIRKFSQLLLLLHTTISSKIIIHNVISAPSSPPPPPPPRPNIIVILVDDLGFGNVGFTMDSLGMMTDNTKPIPSRLNLLQRQVELELASSYISTLAREGRILARHYTHCTCSPSRSSLQTGRLPVHVQTALLNPCHTGAGIPKEMTGIAEKMILANYSTHFVGKWDAGMATPTHIPKGRGYSTSLNFFSHGNWMWTEDVWVGSTVNASRPPKCVLNNGCARDLWDTDGPAIGLNGTLYEERLFADRVLDIINKASGSDHPLFLMYCTRVAHYPLQAPALNQYIMRNVPNPHRRIYLSMLSFLDGVLEEIVDALKKTGKWQNTLLVFTSDNGGVTKEPGRCVEATRGLACFNGEAGASNWPLRGGKYTNWEGGIRVASFVAGGFLPKIARGTVTNGIVHIADWFATFCALAGIDPVDHKAKVANLPAIDSLNVLDLILAKTEQSPRDSVLLSPRAFIWGDLKLLVGVQYGADWGGVLYPNVTTLIRNVYSTTLLCYPACLFNVTSDPFETNDLSIDQPELTKFVLDELNRQAKSIWYRPRTNADPVCMQTAKDRWHGFLGPWQELKSNNNNDGNSKTARYSNLNKVSVLDTNVYSSQNHHTNNNKGDVLDLVVD